MERHHEKGDAVAGSMIVANPTGARLQSSWKRLDIYRYIDNLRYMSIEQIALAFKALAHPHRLAIFLRLAKCCERHGCDADTCSRLCVGDLGKGLGIGQPTVSHHLKELARAGLISTKKSGQSTECWVAETTLDEFARFFVRAKGRARVNKV